MDFVTPGVAPTTQALLRFKLFIRELFPTLGKPTTPTRIDVFTSYQKRKVDFMVLVNKFGHFRKHLSVVF